MDIELMVYGRGEALSDGFHYFARPSCLSEQMDLALSSFYEQRSTVKDYSNIPELRESWGHTYFFYCRPDLMCCTLLRILPAEGDEPGKWLMDAGRGSIWSMEGLCFTYRDCMALWPLIPSMIIWLESSEGSLYARLNRGELKHNIEIPENILFNSYEERMPEQPELVKNSEIRELIYQLKNEICYSSQPFSFVLGTLAEQFNAQLGRRYELRGVYPPDYNNDQLRDPMDNMMTIHTKKKPLRTIEYNLFFTLGSNDCGTPVWKWKLEGKPKNGVMEATDQAILTESGTPYNEKEGIAVFEILASAQAVIKFTESIGWIRDDPIDENGHSYTFKKECAQ